MIAELCEIIVIYDTHQATDLRINFVRDYLSKNLPQNGAMN